ncbi:MAG: glycosyltransferase [Waltera sp.]|uniref:glycosyltransferase n=1 Tax=Waltera sp. TaxID=2815806 RepID=UPI003991DA3F
MKVYQINVVCGCGSTGRIAVDLSRIIKEAGAESRIAYGRGKAPKGIDSIRISNKLDLYHHVVMTRLTDKHGLYSYMATKKLIKDILKYDPDIIHLHNIHGYYINYEILFDFFKKYKRPVVWTLHDCWSFTGHCAHYDSINCKQWKQECRKCPNLNAYPKTFKKGNVYSNFMRKQKAFSQFDMLTLVTPSGWLKKQLEDSFLKGKKCVVIPNGIDLNVFTPQINNNIREKAHLREEQKLILGVASVWTINKGYDDFLKLRRLLDDEYVFCMVGLNNKQIKNLPKGIIGVKKTDSLQELAAYYSAADVFLNLTYEDTFPTTNIEALACGTPVLTYDTGGSTEIIAKGCGESVQKGRADVMAECVRRWCEKPKNSQYCIQRSKEFDKMKNYNRYLSLYRLCLLEKKDANLEAEHSK